VAEREIPAVLSTAHAVAEAARRETLRHFRSPKLVTDNKADADDARSFDPVTIADRAAEAAMRAVLAERRPAGRDPGRGSDGSARQQRPDLGARPDRRDARLSSRARRHGAC
jgi:hypothetical protein